MQGQITIFEWLNDQNDLDRLPEQTMVETIGEALGVKFTKNSFFGDFRAKLPGNITLCIEYENYLEGINGGARFIGVDINTPHAGSSRPCDSIAEAITFLQAGIQRRKEEAKRVRENATA